MRGVWQSAIISEGRVVLVIMFNGNSKKSAVRVSFSGLRPANNKENELSFQNLRRNHATTSECSSSCSHPNQNARIPKQVQPKQRPNFADFSQETFRSTSSVRLPNWPQNQKMRTSTPLRAAYEEAQNIIRQQIESYNTQLNEIMETLTDMQIKDLMKFNELLEKNDEIFRNSQQSVDMQFLRPTIDCSKLKDISRMVTKILSQPQGSFDLRSTYQSKNKKTVSPASSAISPRQCVPTIEGMGSVVDTPESIKSKLSCMSSKLRPEKQAQIGMFDRINITESIDERVSFDSRPQERRKEHRYGRNSEE